MARKITYGAGAHEPIFHRLRAGHCTADEWARWEYETSDRNLDLLEQLGVARAMIACTKGFGLEYEKPLIERAARFAERAAERGILTDVYIQGCPVYYETFLLEVPEAEGWLSRTQSGDYVAWMGQTFRRFMDPTREEFIAYECRMIEYVLACFRPASFFLDNAGCPQLYTACARESFRRYLAETFDSKTAVREFGIPSFEAVDLPHFDPVYWPPDAYRIVKDPILQEWMRWRVQVNRDFVARLAACSRAIDPSVQFFSGSGVPLRVNGVHCCADMTKILDNTWTEEPEWRPGVVVAKPSLLKIVTNDGLVEGESSSESTAVRIATDSRYLKILQHYGKNGGAGLWGEVDRPGKLRALSHNMAFCWKAYEFGGLAPLGADPRMLDDIKDVIDWGEEHIAVLEGRDARVAPIAVWRGDATQAFIRHTPLWEACAIEQMLYENHLPFTILLDDGLERFLGGVQVLILPGTACVSNRQVEVITRFVREGGKLLLLGAAGTMDERTRVRTRYAFEALFGDSLPELSHSGPPHWVPVVDLSRMPERLAAAFGNGRVAFIKHITPVRPLDLTRDVYSPERQVMVKDVLPPANEAEIMEPLLALYGKDALRMDAPRWTLCEYWKQGADLLVCCANLYSGREGGPITLNLGSGLAAEVAVHTLLEKDVKRFSVSDGKVVIPQLANFCAIQVKSRVTTE